MPRLSSCLELGDLKPQPFEHFAYIRCCCPRVHPMRKNGLTSGLKANGMFIRSRTPIASSLCAQAFVLHGRSMVYLAGLVASMARICSTNGLAIIAGLGLLVVVLPSCVFFTFPFNQQQVVACGGSVDLALKSICRALSLTCTSSQLPRIRGQSCEYVSEGHIHGATAG